MEIPGERLGVEPFSTRFLTPEDLRNVAVFQNDTADKSISSILLSPVASILAKYVPSTLAPNVLTLMSLVCVLHACHTTYMYRHDSPTFSTAVAIAMFACYQALDAVDGKHAKNIRNDTPLGYVFNQACDAIGLTFIVLTVCLLLGIEECSLIWYVVQSGHLVFFWAQLSAFNRGYLSWGLFTGPGEALFVFSTLLGFRGLFGLDWLLGVLERIALSLTLVPEPDLGKLVIQSVYYLLLIASTVRVLTLPKEHRSTRNYLLFCLCYRSIPGLLTGWASTAVCLCKRLSVTGCSCLL